MNEFYIYFVHDDGYEDLLWYSEDDDPTEQWALDYFHKGVYKYPKGQRRRLYKIERPSNVKTLLADTGDIL